MARWTECHSAVILARSSTIMRRELRWSETDCDGWAPLKSCRSATAGRICERARRRAPTSSDLCQQTKHWGMDGTLSKMLLPHEVWEPRNGFSVGIEAERLVRGNIGASVGRGLGGAAKHWRVISRAYARAETAERSYTGVCTLIHNSIFRGAQGALACENSRIIAHFAQSVGCKVVLCEDLVGATHIGVTVESANECGRRRAGTREDE
eukprot:6193247-Prymnesium_polylepis.1